MKVWVLLGHLQGEGFEGPPAVVAVTGREGQEV